LPLSAGEGPALCLDERVDALGEGGDDVLRHRDPDRGGDRRVVVMVVSGHRLAQRAGEQVGVVVRDEDAAPHVGQRHGGQRCVAPGHGGVGVAAEAVDQVGGVGGRGRGDRQHLAGPDGQPGVRVVQLGGPVRCRYS
jgi:hypothetical protein